MPSRSLRHRIQIDVKFIAPVKGSLMGCYYQFTAIGDCTRPRVLRLYETASYSNPSVRP